MTNHDDLSNRLRHGVDRGTAPELSSDLVTGAADRTAPHLASPARTLRVAGSAGLAIAALAVAALVVVPNVTPQASPLFAAAESAGQTSAMVAGDSRGATSDSKIGWWVDYNYTAGPSLSNEGGRGEVYRLVLDGSDPEQRIADLAERFGVSGAAVAPEWSDLAYPTLVVGSQDGTDKNVSLSAYGTGDWWFNDPSAVSTYVCDTTGTPEESDEYGCRLTADNPVSLAPTDDEARTLAQELFASTGFTVDAADIDVYSDNWSTSATAYLSVDGQRTALAWSASWSNTGGLAYASGHSVSVESQGTFDTVSATDAVARLEDGRWFGSAGPDFQGGGAIAFAADGMRGTPDPNLVDLAGPDEAVTDATDSGDTSISSPVDPTAPAEPTDAATPEPGAVDPATPMPEETPLPEPTPEVVDVTIDNATATLVMLWDVDGNAWLVPGYAMQMDEGWWNSVVSLVDGVIALPEPMQIEPMVDPESADTGVLVD
ncbi:hypothetical protein HDC94_002333 [Leifsonia sp. AK011]|uniref:hypothetical protein n=1 Tax=Leifsonia sp. AK011 TaxID=2723075 RepID=UPI0015C88B90|nr:hypothetical protein [Leifsonia sp. AK011]NYF11177.1 hypothetical protein [Leifsonia sp. AK011]